MIHCMRAHRIAAAMGGGGDPAEATRAPVRGKPDLRSEDGSCANVANHELEAYCGPSG